MPNCCDEENDQHFGWVPIHCTAAEQPAEEYAGSGKIRAAERNPRQADECEGESPAQHRWEGCLGDGLRVTAPNSLQAEGRSVQATPEDEVPARPVPEAAQQHRHCEVSTCAAQAVAAAAESDEQIVTQPERQGHVPPAPEFTDRARQVRKIEIRRKP